MRTPELTRLALLIGRWELSSPQFPGPSGGVTFEWLPGRRFVVQRWEAPDPAPNGIAVIGAEGGVDAFVQHYFDSRGVKRIYHMTLADRVWRLWRDEEPGFYQRFSAELSANGRSMRGSWETSADGEKWEHDFDLDYAKVD